MKMRHSVLLAIWIFGLCILLTIWESGTSANTSTLRFTTSHSIRIQLAATSDTYVNQNAPDTNFGNTSSLNVRRDEFEQESFALLRFNLASIPTGSVINSAKLYAYLRTVDSGPTIPRLSVFWVVGDWNADTVTWNTKPSTVLTSHFLSVPAETGSSAWLITDMVQCWVDQGALCADPSLALRSHPDSTFAFTRDFDSIEALDRPYLEINYTPPSASPTVGDRVWFDANRNGNQDASETGLAGVRLNLILNGRVVGSDSTDQTGNYLFENLQPNQVYRIDVDDGSLPPGYFLTTRDGPLIVVPNPGSHIRNVDFGYAPPECIPPSEPPAPSSILEVELWPGGCVPYKFEVGTPFELLPRDKDIVRAEALRWNSALVLPDPADRNQTKQYIQFYECTGDCAEKYVLVRYNIARENGNMCGNAGRNLNGETILHFERPTTSLSSNTALHELGHCLGLWHEFNRADADTWLREEPCYKFNPRPESTMPLLGNYDYDSIMHYASYADANDPEHPENCQAGDLRFTDWYSHTFSRFNSPDVSQHDISRLLQYYAWERQRNWGFFSSLSVNSPVPDELPDSSLADGIYPVGTPGIAYQSRGNYDIFALGSDQNLYWKAFRNNRPQSWQSLGCCFASEPSAISRQDGQIDLVTVGAVTGKLVYSHFMFGAWSHWQYVLDGYPPGGIKPGSQAGVLGPAIASRTADSLDVFVVQNDGVLAVTSHSNGQWSNWLSLSSGYNVTARPAAVALSESQVRLAINASDYNLYEPLVTFPPLVPSFSLGILKGTTAYQAAPALAKRDDPNNPYRVLITNPEGRISHRFAQGSWWDIGGIPRPGVGPGDPSTGPSAVATGPYDVYIVINGEDALGCKIRCDTRGPTPVPVGERGKIIQPGGLWLRKFESLTETGSYPDIPAGSD